MATKTAKKKSAKKSTKKKATSRPANRLPAGDRAKKKPASAHQSNGKPEKKAPKTQRLLVSDAFPDRDQNIEELIASYLQAEAATEAAVIAAEDRYAAAQKTLKEAVRAAGLDLYSSYDIDYVVELKKQDDRLKVRKRKKKEPVPTASVAAGGQRQEDSAE